ncbi:hypothetical protein [Streptomyces millisiae]|uniref:DUF8175 domain-containing protein n=1 Tax=Streptomyces millisiae TaxID=3075542 RepID=A0ABU2LNY9_9ACTN|nr:hypothetical protein [Streptomyces sp. DSM 44918]MDT0319296.1 hypothetical protein [Streptomyces sp. DSM 44918]
MRLVNGVPVGYPRSEAGAVQAAVNYQLLRLSKTYRTDTQVRVGVIDAITASEAVEALFLKEELATHRLLDSHGLTRETADSLVARAAALGTRTVGYTDEAAKIQVWMTELVGAPDTAEDVSVAATWTTYTVLLRWQDDDWKLVKVSSDAGPTPLENSGTIPSTAQELRLADRMFRVPPFTAWGDPATSGSAT